MCVSLEHLMLSLLALSSMLLVCADAEDINAEQDSESRPYLLVVTTTEILRMNLDGTNLTVLVNEAAIVAVDYHYRLNLVFWISSFPYHDIKYASLSDGSNVTALRSRDIEDGAGIAVDWIKDKVYWTDRQKHAIYEYDLDTKETDMVMDFPTTSTQGKLKIFPQSNGSSLLYMAEFNGTVVDSKRGGIQRIVVDEREHEKIVHTDCPLSLTLDYRSRDLYWMDGCTYQIGTSKVDGSLYRLISRNGNNFFSHGSSVFQSHLYWTTYDDSKANVYCYNVLTNAEDKIHSWNRIILRDLQLVHSSNQPSGLELGDLNECQKFCGHGRCVPSKDECSCNEGWTGPSCSEDVNECETANGGCEQQCFNIPGSFFCKCDQGMILDSNQRSCRTTPTTIPETTSAPPTTIPETTSAPTTAIPETTSAPTTAIPETTSAPPTTSPTTASPQTTPSTAVSATSEPPSTSFSPDDGQESTLPLTTDHDMATEASDISTTGQERLNTEDGLKAREGSGAPMILVVVFGAVLLIIIIAASMYVAFLFFKCKQRRKGSYNVHARHQSKQQSPDSNAELGTSSVHSSFRDITVQYQRERMLVGMLGNAGDLDQGEEPCEAEPGLRWSRSEGGESSSSCGLILETVPELHTATDQIQHTL